MGDGEMKKGQKCVSNYLTKTNEELNWTKKPYKSVCRWLVGKKFLR
jgi:hypothetical protein